MTVLGWHHPYCVINSHGTGSPTAVLIDAAINPRPQARPGDRTLPHDPNRRTDDAAAPLTDGVVKPDGPKEGRYARHHVDLENRGVGKRGEEVAARYQGSVHRQRHRVV